MARKKALGPFVLCVNNEPYPASLVVGKVYPVTRDGDAAALGFVRVVDESGEDYLFSQSLFVPIDLPASVTKVLRSSNRDEAKTDRRAVRSKSRTRRR